VDIRNVQKTGNMFYVYLPTNWVKQYGIKAGTKVSTYQRNDGSLAINPDIQEKELEKLDLNLSKEDQTNVNKLIAACYLNPLKSFSITLEKEMEISKILLQKKPLSIELIEFDGKRITCESSFNVDDPFSLLKTMIKKVKNLLYVMRSNYNKELIDRYEEEIDRSKMHVTKAVISVLTHNTPTKYKIVELHYMAVMARDLERLVDHLKEIPDKEQKYLSMIEKIISKLDKIFTNIEGKQSKQMPQNIKFKDVMEFTRKSKEVPFEKVKNPTSYHKVRVKAALEGLAENLMNWTITEEIYEKTK